MSIVGKIYGIEPIYKHTVAVLDYELDWSTWLGADVIVTSTWVVAVGLDEVRDSYDNTTATVWLSGGVEGGRYLVNNTITTNLGRTETKSFLVVIQTR
jgi:hypothetical protein